MLTRTLALLIILVCLSPAQAAIDTGANVQYIPATTNLGIGYISPTYQLAVNGTTFTKALNLNGTSMSLPSLTQGDLLFSRVSGSLNNLAKGATGRVLKVNGNTLAWEALASTSAGGSDTYFQFNDGGTSFGGNGALTFTKGSKTLAVAADAPLDINSTSVSIADTIIEFDGASATFNGAGAMTLSPANGSNLNVNLRGVSDFIVDTSKLVVNNNGNVGISYVNPIYKLAVNGSTFVKNFTMNGNSFVASTLNQGSLLVAKAAGSVQELLKGTNHYVLKTNGNALAWEAVGAGGASNIDGLSDGRSNVYNVFLGNGAGAVDTGTSYSTGVGINALKNNVADSGLSNSAFGYNALQSNTDGGENTAIGFMAMNGSTSGYSNTAIGSGALSNNISGHSNTAIGTNSLRVNTSGIYNTGMGYMALGSNITGIRNTSIGVLSAYSGTSASNGTYLGFDAGYSISSGVDNTFLGYFASINTTTGGYNTSVGSNALAKPTTGARNTAVGYFAGEGTSGSNFSNGTFLGYQTGLALTTGGRNSTLLGYQAGLALTTGYNSTMVGYGAGIAVTNGNGNILLGYQAGDAITTGARNIIIGYDVDAPSASARGQLSIGNLIYGNGMTATGTTVSSGKVGINKANPAYTLDVNGTTFTKAFALNGTALSLAQGSLLYSKVAGSAAMLPRGTNHYALKVNGNALAWETVPSSSGTSNIDGLSDGRSNVYNVYLGNGAGAVDTGTSYSTGVGINALKNNVASSGLSNSAFGYYSLNGNTTGDYNTAIGGSVLRYNTTGYLNTGIGFEALVTNTTGNGNTGIGAGSIFSNSTGNFNTGVGNDALVASSTGSYNTAVGAFALPENQTGSNNTALGGYALRYPKTGSSNTAVGYQAGEGSNNQNFSNGTFLGYQTGLALTTGRNNTLLGYQAGLALTTGYNSTMLGYGAGIAVTNGNGNILLGYQAGDAITTGARNIIIGYDVDAPSASARGQLSIGNLIYGNGMTATGTTVSSGKVGINKANPAYTLDVNGTTFTKAFALNGTALSLTQGSLLYSKVAGSAAMLAKGTNHYALKVNGNALAWEALASTSAGGSDTYFQFNDGGTSFGGNGALSFTKGSKTLAVAADAPLDINSTSVSIADTIIEFDGASATFNGAGAMTLTPANGSNLNVNLRGLSDLVVDTNKLVVDNNGNVGIGTTSMQAKLEVNGVIMNTSEYNAGNSGTAVTIDWNNGNKQVLTMTGACTITFTGPSGGASNFMLRMVQDGTGTRTVTAWPASVKWSGGTAPVLTTTPTTGVDLISCYYNGTNYYCMAGLDFY